MHTHGRQYVNPIAQRRRPVISQLELIRSLRLQEEYEKQVSEDTEHTGNH